MCVTEEDEATMQIMSELRYNFMIFVINLALTHNIVKVMLQMCPCLNMN